MSGKTELLPCPFCGGEAEVTCAGRGKYQAQARCTQCHCELGAWYISKRAAAHAWNTRAERTCECVSEYAESPFDGKTIVLHRCSECHELMRPHMLYCPNCGRKVSA